jgi:hypothetical protein
VTRQQIQGSLPCLSDISKILKFPPKISACPIPIHLFESGIPYLSRRNTMITVFTLCGAAAKHKKGDLLSLKGEKGRTYESRLL